MSESDEMQASASGDEELKPIEDGLERDWFLQSLVSLVNDRNFEVGITLTFGGSTVSGVMIGGEKYFEEFGAEFSNGLNWPDAEATARVKESFAQHRNLYIDGASPFPGFIHLRDARVFSPDGGQLPNNRGVMWRGRLSQVSGFSLGTLTSS